ncbi:MAG: hypothetical protein D6711_02695 [Chloroflexi bacterium]|nr:MAG: hypothetical protein D6711_02695 [Chloroflexota bacterium]
MLETTRPYNIECREAQPVYLATAVHQTKDYARHTTAIFMHGELGYNTMFTTIISQIIPKLYIK